MYAIRSYYVFEGHVTRRKIKYFIEKMCEAQLLNSIGSGSATHYVLSDDYREKRVIIDKALKIGFEELKKRGEIN